MPKAAAEWLIFPLGVGALTAWACVAPALDLAGCFGLSPTLNAGLSVLPTILVFTLLLALLERWLPYRPDWNRSQGDLSGDVLHLAITAPLSQLLVQATAGVGLIALAGALAAHVGPGVWPREWPPLAQLLLALALAELGHYVFHRISHENGLVWRLHAPHHAAPRLYWLNAVRFHVLDLVCLVGFQLFPLIALGAPPHALASYTIFSSVYGYFQHCNVALRTGALDFVFSTPALHRYHHSTDPREGNQNYGAILSLWDLVFRTFYRPRGREFAGPVGIAALPEFPRSWLGQQLAPLRYRRIARENTDVAR